jgi:DNA gyrase subunit B
VTTIREGLTAVVSVKIPGRSSRADQDQAREHRVKGIVEAGRQRQAGRLPRENPTLRKKVVAKRWTPPRRAKRRGKARDLVRRKGALDSSRCRANSPTARNATPRRARSTLSEGSPQAARPSRAATAASRRFLPIKGKILNVEKARFDKMLSSDEIKTMIAALGSGIGSEDFEPSKLR